MVVHDKSMNITHQDKNACAYICSNYFISAIFLKIFEKIVAIKSLLKLHFKGFGAISRPRACRILKTVHFGIGDVPKCPTDDRFMKIFVFFAIFVGRRVPFFGHSLLSYSKTRHLGTSRVIPLTDCHQSLYHQHRILSTFFKTFVLYG